MGTQAAEGDVVIAIVNIGGPDGNGEHSYSVRINRDEICRFTHRREDGLELCLLRAAQAVQKRNSLTMADICNSVLKEMKK